MGGKMPREYHRAYEKIYYARPEIKKRRAAQMRAYAKDPELRKRHEARWLVNRAVASGRLIPDSCESCDSEIVQAHHDDYNKPLDIRWLCHPCHRKEHAQAEGQEVK